MSGDDPQKNARQSGAAAVAGLEGAKESFTANPIFQALEQAVLGLAQNPLTLGPDQVRMINESDAATAQAAARNQLSESRAQRSNTSGVRSGPAAQDEINIAAALGDQLGSRMRETMIQAALQRPQDIGNATSIGTGLLAQLFGLDQAIAAAHQGNSQMFSQFAGTDPLSQGFGALGTLGGAVLGNANLFGGGDG